MILVLLAIPLVLLFAASTGAGTSPTLTSNKVDYTPGETVVLTGTGWDAGEVVHVVVDDASANGWRLESSPNPVADGSGSFTYLFQLPTYFVSHYIATATGATSGTATTTFTDGPLPASVSLTNWETKPSGGWVTGTLGTNNSDYKEGETVPFRIEMKANAVQTSGNPWYAPVCRDYSISTSGGTVYGYTQLMPFNTSRTADPGGTIGSTSGAFSGVGLTITQVYDPGASSGTLDGNTFNCGSTQRLVIVKFDAVGDVDRYLLWGGRLSKPGDTSPVTITYGHSSSFYPGGSLQMRLASPDKTGGINPGAIIQLAKLTVTKVVDSGSATPDQWSFHVTGPNGYDVTQQIPSGQSSVDFVGLETGTYTVTESSVSGYVFVSGSGTNCTFSGSTATCTVTAAAGGATNASATFHNAQQTGSLKISKVFDPGTSGFTGKFSIAYDCDDGTAHDGTVSLAAGESTTISGIPINTKCTVSETPPTPPTGWSFGTPSISPTQPVTINSTTTAVEVTVTNTITRDQGYFKIKKEFDPKTSGFTGKFSIDYKCGTADKVTVELGAGETTAALGPFDTGTQCTVSEPALPTAPTGWTFGDVSVSGSPVTITKGGTADAQLVTVTNTITRDTGSLKVKKELTGGPTSGYNPDYTISWDCDDGTGSPYDGSTTVKAGAAAVTARTGIPTGTKCTVSETLPDPPAGYSFDTPTYDPAATVTIATKDAAVTVTVKNTLRRLVPDSGVLKLTKVLTGGPTDYKGPFGIDYVCKSGETTVVSGTKPVEAGSSASVDVPFYSASGVYLLPITCTVTEPTLPTAPDGYKFGTKTFDPADGKVTFTKEVTSYLLEVKVSNVLTTAYAKVLKTVSGQPPASGQTFTFELRSGASTTSDGTTLETKTTDATGNIAFTIKLVPGQTYQICEWVFPGWNTNLAGDGALFVPNSIIPPSLPNPNVNNLTVCADFSVTVPAGDTTATRTFTVDNTPPPGGRALTIGFWKNWASCSNSNGKGQMPALDQTLAAAIVIGDTTDGHSTLPGIVISATSGTWAKFGATYRLVLHGSTATPNSAPDCLKAVRLLGKQRIDGAGKQMSSDPAFNLAAQLVAAELNFTVPAYTSPKAVIAVNQSVLLLGKVAFNGITHGNISKADVNTMNCLAGQLDDYNNNRTIRSCPTNT